MVYQYYIFLYFEFSYASHSWQLIVTPWTNEHILLKRLIGLICIRLAHFPQLLAQQILGRLGQDSNSLDLWIIYWIRKFSSIGIPGLVGFASYVWVQKIVDPWLMSLAPTNGARWCQCRQKSKTFWGMNSHRQETKNGPTQQSIRVKGEKGAWGWLVTKNIVLLSQCLIIQI